MLECPIRERYRDRTRKHFCWRHLVKAATSKVPTCRSQIGPRALGSIWLSSAQCDSKRARSPFLCHCYFHNKSALWRVELLYASFCNPGVMVTSITSKEKLQNNHKQPTLRWHPDILAIRVSSCQDRVLRGMVPAAIFGTIEKQSNA